MVGQAKGTFSGAAKDRRVRVAAGALVAAGAAALAKMVADRVGKRNRGQGVSRSLRLRAEEPPTDGMRRIARGRAERALDRLREARTVVDPAACIHGARKDLKKLRAVARLLRAELGDDLYRAENRRYRDAGRRLSASRDAEAKLEALDRLCRRYGDRFPGSAVAEWRGQLAEERDRAAAAAREGDAETLAAAIAAVEEGAARIDEWPLERESWKLVGPGLKRYYRRGRKAMRRAAADPSAENMHEWRKRAKDLWYHLRILRETRPEEIEGATERAGELAEALGYHHDLAVLRDDLILRELAGPRWPLVESILERQAELAADAFDRGEKLYARKPKAFLREMRAGWKRRRG